MTQGQGRLVVITGATGRQGGATLQALLVAGGWRLRAISRDPQSEAARALRAQGVEVVKGDQEDQVSLDGALKGAYGVFSVQSALPIEAEQRQARNLADAAKRAGVSHFVATLSASAGKESTGVARFESKRAIAVYIRSLGVPYTILRPPTFMENFLQQREAILQGKLGGDTAPGTKQWYIAVSDIGSTAAAAFAQPARFTGQEVDLGADVLTNTQVAETLSRVLGRSVTYVQTPRDELLQRTPAERVAMTDWYDRVGYNFDVPALRARWGLPWMTLEQWLRKGDWARRP